LDRLGVEAAAGDQPGDERIRVPHLSCLTLVPSPDECWHGGYEIEETPRVSQIARQLLWAVDRLAHVREDSVAPPAGLVTEDPEASRPAAPDRTFDDNATCRPVIVADGRLLDHEPALRHAHDERRVVEVRGRPPLDSSCDSLIEAPIQPN
jgi:hypothetical protein